MKKIIFFLIFFLASLALPVASLAQLVTLPNPLSAPNFLALLTNIANWIATIVGTLAIIMFVWAGILFLTSAGNEAQVTKAKKAVIWATIGLAIALLGTGLIQLVQQIISP